MRKQEWTDAERLLHEIPRIPAFITGSEAVAEAVKRANVDMTVAYPITPQSESMHLVGDLFAQGYIRDYYRAENEFAVMAAVHGASLGGGRVFTATSGPGTLRAMEMFPVWAGARQPIVCAFMCRGVALPPSIQPENIEMGMLLDTGMLMFHAENAQDFHDMILAAYPIAEQSEVHLPIGVFVDGFFVTHTKEKVMLPAGDASLPPYDSGCAPVPVFDMETPPIRVTRDPLLNKSNFISGAANALTRPCSRSLSLASARRVRASSRASTSPPCKARRPSARSSASSTANPSKTAIAATKSKRSTAWTITP